MTVDQEARGGELAAREGIRCSGPALRAISRRRRLRPRDVVGYLRDGEDLVGFGDGGSESLLLFVRRRGGAVVARKVLTELLVLSSWDSGGRGVMAPPLRKARLQIDYLRALPAGAAAYFPEVLDVEEREVPDPYGRRSTVHELIYDQVFLPGADVSAFVAEAQPDPALVGRVYQELAALLRERLHGHRRRPRLSSGLENDHFGKIEQRLALARETAPETFGTGLLDSRSLLLNGRSLANIGPLLQFFREEAAVHERLEPDWHCLVMGDSNTENVKITNLGVLDDARLSGRSNFSYDDIGLRLMDPRALGADDSEGAGAVDDLLYDAKFWHNSIAGYDIMHRGLFRLMFDLRGGQPVVDLDPMTGNPYQRPYLGVGRHLPTVIHSLTGDGQDAHDPWWFVRFVFLMGSHFCAMVPFHVQPEPDGHVVDDWRRHRRAIALYCEGLRWLNWAAALLTESTVDEQRHLDLIVGIRRPTGSEWWPLWN